MLWVKSLHIIAVICWFAGIFYLPRLFVYHAQCKDEIGNERFKVMESRLYNGIMTPSAIATLVFGFWLLRYGFWGSWMIVKFALVVLVLAYHIWCGYVIRLFRSDNNIRSDGYYRIMNELPVLLMIPIVVLVVVKPF